MQTKQQNLIQRIQDLLSKNPSGLTLQQLSDFLNDVPYGSISSICSAMTATGNLIHNQRLRILPLFPKKAVEISSDIAKFLRDKYPSTKRKAKRNKNPNSTIFDQIKPVEPNAIEIGRAHV